MRLILVAVVVAAACPVCNADARPDPYDALNDVIMVRTPLDGPTDADPVSPLHWSNPRYPVSSRSFDRLMQSRAYINSLPCDQIEAHSTPNRSIPQHHLWTVFDWMPLSALSMGEPCVLPSKLCRIQSELEVAIERLALSDADIQSLPCPLTTTDSAFVAVDFHDNPLITPFLVGTQIGHIAQEPY